MPRSVKAARQDPIEQPPASDVRPLEAEVRAADLESADAGADEGVGSEDVAQPGTSREARIREAAYAAYERRGRTPGREEEDWLEAERSIDADGDETGGAARQP